MSTAFKDFAQVSGMFPSTLDDFQVVFSVLLFHNLGCGPNRSKREKRRKGIAAKTRTVCKIETPSFVMIKYDALTG